MTIKFLDDEPKKNKIVFLDEPKPKSKVVFLDEPTISASGVETTGTTATIPPAPINEQSISEPSWSERGIIGALNPMEHIKTLPFKSKEDIVIGEIFPMLIPELRGGAALGSGVAKTALKETMEGGLGNLAREAVSTIKNKGGKVVSNIIESLTKPRTLSTPKPVEPIVAETPLIQTPQEKLMDALKNAKSVRRQTETLYSQERGARLGKAMETSKDIPGEAKLYSQLGQLKGELPKVEFESIRSKVGQDDIDSLFNQIYDSPKIREGFEQINAAKGLGKIFGQYGGKVPTEGELKLLNKVFGEDFTKAVLEKQGLFTKMKNIGLDIANIPRSIMASADLSAPFRQGLVFSTKKEFWKAMPDMFKFFGSEKAYQALQESIVSRPSYRLMEESGLSLTDLASITGREERFTSSIAEKIPALGNMLRASSRAYTGFLNKVRADVFDNLVAYAERSGLKPQENMDLTSNLANYINMATGRGKLPNMLAGSAELLNTTLFSPKLIASRLRLLNPVEYVKMDAFTRKEALKSMFQTAGAITSLLSLAKVAGAKIGTDPRSSDFGKIILGNTRVDLGGGFLQYLVLGSRLATGQSLSTTTGKVKFLGEGYKADDRLDIVMRSIQNKLAPTSSFVLGLARGKTYMGEDFNVPKEIALRFVPIMTQDIYELYKDDPKSIPLAALGTFGVGIQTYAKETPDEIKARKIANDNAKKKKSGLIDIIKSLGGK